MKKLLLSVCLAAACWVSDVGAMQENRKVCEAYSLGTSEADGKLLYECTEFPNLEQIEIEDESMWSFIEPQQKSFPRLKKIIGKRRIEFSSVESIYDVEDEYGNPQESHMKRCLKEIARFQTIEELDISGWRLWDIIEPITNLQNLRVLRLSNCGLRELPESIGNLKNLEKLDLAFSDEDPECYLEGFPINSISRLPESIGNLENLQYLSLNEPFSLPESMKKLSKLKKLNLWDNSPWVPFSSLVLPDFLWEMPSLEDVIVSESLLESTKLRRRIVARNRNLVRVLSAWKNRQKWSDEQLRKFAMPLVNGRVYF